jgi:hypothetical protein
VISPVAFVRAVPAQADVENARAPIIEAVKAGAILLATGLIRANLIPSLRAYTSPNTSAAAR